MDAVAWVLGLGIAAYLLMRFPIKMLILLATGASIGALIYVVEDLLPRLEREKMSIEVWYDGKRCGTQFPLWISLTNGSSRDLIETSFSISGFREGYSKPLYDEGSYSTDRIVPPGRTYGTCWSLPRQHYDASPFLIIENPPQTLDWRATVDRVSFEK